MPDFTDQLGRTIHLPVTPSRIISLVPSQTELLFDLGLDEQVVGITKFCVHPPEWFYTKTRVGGTKKLHLNTIYQLQPDLIIANKEENTKEEVEELANACPTWISNITTLENASEMIAQLGVMTGTATKSRTIVEMIDQEFNNLKQTLDRSRSIRAAYLIWNDPIMTVGSNTFIHEMLTQAGFINIFAGKERYPLITIDDLKKLNCEIVLLSSEPFPFRQKHVEHLNALLPGITIMLVDGEMFSWYGSRLQYAPRYFKQLREEYKL